MDYLAKFEPDGDGVLVTFPDVPEAVTGGSSEEEALTNAIDALEVALLTYAADGRDLPSPTSSRLGEKLRAVPVSAATTAKLAFISAFRESGLTRVELARRLGKAEGEVRRMLDPYHATKLGSLEAGLKVLGRRLVVTVERAA